MRIKSAWQFIPMCMECTVIGSIEKVNMLPVSTLQQILLSKAIEIIDIAEKDFKAIIISKTPEYVSFKDNIQVGFTLIFESMNMTNKFISHFNK